MARIKSLKDLQKLDVEAETSAIEADVGHKVRGMRQALREMKAGKGTVHTSQELAERQGKHQRVHENRKL